MMSDIKKKWSHYYPVFTTNTPLSNLWTRHQQPVICYGTKEHSSGSLLYNCQILNKMKRKNRTVHIKHKFFSIDYIKLELQGPDSFAKEEEERQSFLLRVDVSWQIGIIKIPLRKIDVLISNSISVMVDFSDVSLVR